MIDELTGLRTEAATLTAQKKAIDADSDPSKTLVLVGGGWQFPETEDPYGVSIYLDVLKRSGGIDNAKIGIFTTASSTPRRAKENGELYVEDFEVLYDKYLKREFPNSKIDVEWIPFHIGNYNKLENNKSFLKKLRGYTGFIFGGGDQSLITQAFFNENRKTGEKTKTGIFKVLENKYENGAVIAGTSAGTTVQSGSPMITEGESYEALEGEPTEKIGSPPFVRDLYYNPLGGLGFFNYGLLDTHFSERGRQGRIIRLASEVKEDLTFGVDENTALIVTDADTPDVNMEVLGEGGVFISDLTNAKANQKDGFSIRGVRATYITEGDEYDPLTRRATFGNKTRLVGEETGDITVTQNIFSYKDPESGDWTDPRSFTNAAIELFNSRNTVARGVSLETDPVRYGVVMKKTNASAGYMGEDSLGAERVSFENLTVAISPIGRSR